MPTWITAAGRLLQRRSATPSGDAGAALQANIDACDPWIMTRAPTANDDGANTGGAGPTTVTQLWIDTATTPRSVYVCANNATGAAVWQQIYPALASANALQQATVVATSALPTNAYANGTAGVGATLTATAHGVLTVDGHAVALNDVVLVTDEAAPANNGVYVCTTAGASGAYYVLTRVAWLNSAGQFVGALVPVGPDGTVAANTLWQCQATAAPTIGTTAIAFAPVEPPVFGASGASHSAGAVPDPGSTAGTTRFLREDATWDTAGGAPAETQTDSGGGCTFTTATNEFIAIVSAESSTTITLPASPTIVNASLTIDNTSGGGANVATLPDSTTVTTIPGESVTVPVYYSGSEWVNASVPAAASGTLSLSRLQTFNAYDLNSDGTTSLGTTTAVGWVFLGGVITSENENADEVSIMISDGTNSFSFEGTTDAIGNMAIPSCGNGGIAAGATISLTFTGNTINSPTLNAAAFL